MFRSLTIGARTVTLSLRGGISQPTVTAAAMGSSGLLTSGWQAGYASDGTPLSSMGNLLLFMRDAHANCNCNTWLNAKTYTYTKATPYAPASPIAIT
jgi:hypothetical protein